MAFFPDPAEMSAWSLLFMMAVYGYILLQAAQLISAGCDLIVLLYGPGLVGSLLIPILGALPDCLIILFSGIGDGTKEEIQTQLQVGVGTLVGSTVMLLTLPWAAAVYLGRRDLDPATGEAAYTVTAKGSRKPLTTKTSLTESCVTTLDDVPMSAKILMLLSLSYWVIQVPAFFYHTDGDKGAYHEKPYALSGLIVSLLALAFYCGYQVFSADREEQTRRQQEAQKRKQWQQSLHKKFSLEMYQEEIFHKHDTSGDGNLDSRELYAALTELGLKIERRDVAAMLASLDIGDPDDPESKGDGKLSLSEFKHAIRTWMRMETGGHPHHHHHADGASSDANADLRQRTAASPLLRNEHQSINMDAKSSVSASEDGKGGESDDEDEEEDEEDQQWDLTDTQLKIKGFGLLAIATLIASVFSDPMVDAISAFGQRINIDAFYISFVITPVASNASEVIAGLIFAAKRTNESISMCHSSLLGGGSMNATMCLAVFMALIYFRGLTWSFSAEVITLCVVTVIVSLNSALSRTIRLWQAVLVGSLYPLAILMIYIMKSAGGLD